MSASAPPKEEVDKRAAGFEMAKQEMEYRVELFGKCVSSLPRHETR